MKDQKSSDSRADTKETGFRRILVAFDGSEYSRRALKTAAILAKVHGSKLFILYVTAPSVYSYGRMSSAYIDRIDRIARQEADAVLKTARDQVRDTSLKIKTEVIERTLSLVQAITEHAAKRNADLIVVGTRGMSGFKKLILGSVSSGVVAHAPCPVLVVR